VKKRGFRKEGEQVSFSFYEHFRKVKRELTPAERKKPPYLLNIPELLESDGRLTIKLNERWGSYKKWSDRKDKALECRLNEVIVEIVTILEGQIIEKRKKEAGERAKVETLRRREEENRRREKLEGDVALWRKSRDIREFIHAYESKLIERKGTIDPDSNQAAWLTWAKNYANSIDPLIRLAPEDSIED